MVLVESVHIDGCTLKLGKYWTGNYKEGFVHPNVLADRFSSNMSLLYIYSGGTSTRAPVCV